MNSLKIYFDRRIIAILFLGFSSGLPLALTASTLGTWLFEAGISKSAIGLFAAVTIPYALKFLWAPLIDGVSFPLLGGWLGHRRGWLMATQLALMASIALLGLANPVFNPWLTAAMALLVAIFSATQDIVIDAYRVEILEPEQYGAGAATIVLGYRLGMIVSSAGALKISSHLNWLTTYEIMAMLMAVGMVAMLLSKEPAASARYELAHARKNSFIEWLREHIVAPFADFMTRPQWLPILLFILLYKLSDAFMGGMTNPFLLDIGFVKDDIANILKIYGVIATIIGSFIGGSLVFRLGMLRTLWICGIIHMLTNFMFVAQAHIGADINFLTLSITLENISGGMGTAAFVAYMSSLCNLSFTATQYALLSSFSAFGRTWLSTPAGWFSEHLGWEGFFTLSALLSLPGLLVLWLLTRNSEAATPEGLRGQNSQ